MKPRAFQLQAMADVGAALRAGKRGIAVVAPTGAGKSYLMAMMAERFVRQGKRCAWGAHRDELLVQGAAALRACGVESGMNGLNRGAPVQIGSYQSWSARGQAPDADVFFADEIHHLGDRVGWQRISAAYRAAGKILIGATATPARGDDLPLTDCDHIVVATTIQKLVGLGLLVPLRWRGPAATLASQKIARDPVDAYIEEAAGRAAVVFAPHLKAAKAYLDGFLARGIRARLVEGNMPADERAATLSAFAENRGVDVLVNVHLLCEGWDAPRCDCVIMARGCSSIVMWIQSVGRGLRPYCGCGRLARGEACSCLKKDCLLLDLRGIAHDLGRPDAEATYSLDGAGIVLAQDASIAGERLCKVCKVPLPPKEVVCPECGKDNGPKIPKSVNAPLTDWEVAWDAAKAAVKPSNIVVGLAGILRKADEAARKGKPWKDSAIHTRVRFSMAWMRRAPSAQEWAAARHLIAAAEKFEPPQRSLGT